MAARIISVIILLSFLSAGCVKDTGCKPKAVKSEEPAIQAYAASKGINAVQLNNTGLYYEIMSPGSGNVPNSNSIITTNYTGELLDGTVFDASTSPVTFPLNGVIAGWQLGIPLIKKGGSIKLIVPSSLAYGCKGIGSIPPDAILYFNIELTNVQ
jgi:FKBP-type peptidyl-prolyl cis-trans isomerase